MKIFTIGFTKKSAEQFFTALSTSGVQRVADVRLNNISQLAGFSKRDDLRYFLRTIGEIDYVHLPELAPEAEMLEAYRSGALDWAGYEASFTGLIRKRQVEACLDPAMLDHSCLLCSEATPEHCHRRIVAEYLQAKWNDVEVVHL